MAAQRRTAPVQRVPLDGTQSGASASERTPLTLGRLAPKKGSWPKRTRIGRGHGSGLVKTGGKGGKGQTVRSGGGKGPSFEGGQTPWARRLPHRLGYSQKARDIGHFRTTFSVVNLCDLADWDVAVEVSPQSLKEKGKLKKLRDGVKILGGPSRGRRFRKVWSSGTSFSRRARAKRWRRLGRSSRTSRLRSPPC